MDRLATLREVAKMLGGGHVDPTQETLTLRVRGGVISLSNVVPVERPEMNARHAAYTSIVGTYTSIDDFRFAVQSKTALNRLKSLFKGQVVKMAREANPNAWGPDAEFDAHLIVTANNPEFARRLFADTTIRKILLTLEARRTFTVEVRGARPGSLTTVGGSTHDIIWGVSHAEEDVFVLVALFQLITKLLGGLRDLGSARE